MFIRVDANHKIGWGHLIRTIAFAQMLRKCFNIRFICRDVSQTELNILKKEGFEVSVIKSEEKFVNSLEETEVVVVDGYHFTSDYYKSIKQRNAFLISIQDIFVLEDFIDLVINHLPGSDKHYSKNVKLLSGPKYALVRKEFLSQTIEYQKSVSENNVKSFLISLGATLNYKIINRICDLLSHIEPESRIMILTSEENLAYINGNGKEVYVNLSAPEVVQLIDAADFCLISPGMISYEVFYRIRPVIMGALNNGQESIAKDFSSLGLVNYIGFWNSLETQQLSRMLKKDNNQIDVMRTLFNRRNIDLFIKSILEIVENGKTY